MTSQKWARRKLEGGLTFLERCHRRVQSPSKHCHAHCKLQQRKDQCEEHRYMMRQLLLNGSTYNE